MHGHRPFRGYYFLIAYTYLSQQVSNFVSQMEKLGSLYLAIVEADKE